MSRRVRFSAMAGCTVVVAMGAALIAAGTSQAAPAASAPSPYFGTVDTVAAPLTVRSTPLETATGVGSLTSHTRVGIECKIEDGKLIERDGETSRTWYKIDTSRSDGSAEVPGWISGIYTKVFKDPKEKKVPICKPVPTEQKVPEGAGLEHAVGN
ncbi:hypothetical protein ACFYM0_36205 [Streptomyces sp. NPDC006487]|uniref:hypothetical protein n=1 Tax=Streptomyces sp. NPDC006487 TaxID=3364748 RepID=UPI00369EC05B